MNPELITILNRYFTLLENNRALHQRIVTANFANEQNMYNLIHSLVNTNPINHRFSPRTRARSRNNISLFNLNNLFQDVIIRPSEEQINNSTRTIAFRDITNPINIQCPISQENFNPEDEVTQIIHCGHIFCKNSISRWFTSSVHCPICRYDIRTNSESENTSSPEHTNSTHSEPENANNSDNNTMSEQTNNLNTNLNNIFNSVLSEFNNSTQDPNINNLLNFAEQLTNNGNNTNGVDVFYTIQR